MAFDTDILLIIVAAGGALAVALGLHTEWRMSRLTRGKGGKVLEDVIIKSAADIEKFKQFRKELEGYLLTVEKRLGRSIQAAHTVRFNPFKGTGDGGNQSFATAFLDEHGNGVVLSTLYTRERMSVFAKPLKDGKSEYELTGEEREAVKRAKEKLQT